MQNDFKKGVCEIRVCERERETETEREVMHWACPAQLRHVRL